MNIVDILIEKRFNYGNENTNLHAATFVEKSSSNISDIKIGVNTYRQRYSNSRIKIHAEIDALKKCKFRNHVMVDLFVIRINRNKELKGSKPCAHCIRELKSKKFLKIRNLYYSTDSGEIDCVKFDKFSNDYITRSWENIRKPNY